MSLHFNKKHYNLTHFYLKTTTFKINKNTQIPLKFSILVETFFSLKTIYIPYKTYIPPSGKQATSNKHLHFIETIFQMLDHAVGNT